MVYEEIRVRLFPDAHMTYIYDLYSKNALCVTKNFSLEFLVWLIDHCPTSSWPFMVSNTLNVPSRIVSSQLLKHVVNGRGIPSERTLLKAINTRTREDNADFIKMALTLFKYRESLCIAAVEAVYDCICSGYVPMACILLIHMELVEKVCKSSQFTKLVLGTFGCNPVHTFGIAHLKHLSDQDAPGSFVRMLETNTDNREKFSKKIGGFLEKDRMVELLYTHVVNWLIYNITEQTHIDSVEVVLQKMIFKKDNGFMLLRDCVQTCPCNKTIKNYVERVHGKLLLEESVKKELIEEDIQLSYVLELSRREM